MDFMNGLCRQLHQQNLSTHEASGHSRVYNKPSHTPHLSLSFFLIQEHAFVHHHKYMTKLLEILFEGLFVVHLHLLSRPSPPAIIYPQH